MCKVLTKWLSQYSDWALVPLRIVVGLSFLFHGWGKLFGAMPGLEAWTGMLGGMGVPAAGLMAWVVGLIELLGGAALLLGIGVEVAGLLLAVVMLVAIVMVHAKDGFFLPGGYEYALTLLGASLTLALTGAGKKLNLGKKYCK
jgi:putative oxidoreductase